MDSRPGGNRRDSVPGVKGRPFEVAERFLRQAERDGRIKEAVRNGWIVDDFDDGGLQFDNGLAGVALLRVFEVTGDERYRAGARAAADWAVKRRVVTNWNYNSFSVYLLAEMHASSGDARYLEAAKKKTLLGVLPGQLASGSHTGRWADQHNARPPYHYILIRGLASLANAMSDDDPDLPTIVNAIRLAFRARNPDFKNGVINLESAVEALVHVQMLRPALARQFADCGSSWSSNAFWMAFSR